DDLERYALRQFDGDRYAVEQRDHAFHVFLKIGGAVADEIGGQMYLLEIVRIHEHIFISVLIEIVERKRIDEGPFHLVGRLVAHHGFDAIRDAAHVDGGGWSSLAWMEAFGFQHDIDLAILVFDDIAFTHGGCDDLGHEHSL